MFGISFAEFFVILLVAILVIPAKNWPDVARFLARVIRAVRSVIWHLSDATEKIKEQIDLEKPIDEVIKTTTDEMLDGISVKRKKRVEPTSVKKKGRGKK